MKARCDWCDQVVRVVLPAGGDGSGWVYIRHRSRKSSDPCKGSRLLVKEEDLLDNADDDAVGSAQPSDVSTDGTVVDEAAEQRVADLLRAMTPKRREVFLAICKNPTSYDSPFMSGEARMLVRLTNDELIYWNDLGGHYLVTVDPGLKVAALLGVEVAEPRRTSTVDPTRRKKTSDLVAKAAPADDRGGCAKCRDWHASCPCDCHGSIEMARMHASQIGGATIPLPDFGKVKEIRHGMSIAYTKHGRDVTVLICPALGAGRRGRYHVIEIDRATSSVRCIGNELPLGQSRQIADRAIEGTP